MIHSLRSGLDFGRRHLALVGLQTDHDAFVNVAALPPRPPTPAKSVTVAIFYQLTSCGYCISAWVSCWVVVRVAVCCMLYCRSES